MDDNFDEVVAAAEAALHGGEMVSAAHSAALPSSVVPAAPAYNHHMGMPQQDLQARGLDAASKGARASIPSFHGAMSGLNDDEEHMAAAVAAGIEGVDVEDSPAPGKQRRPRKPHVRAAASEEVASWAESSWRALGKVGRTASGKAKAMVTATDSLVGPRPLPISDEDKMAVEHQMGKTQLLLYVGAHRGCTANSFQVAEDLRRIEGGHLYPTAYEAALAHDELIRKMQPQEHLRLVNYKLPGSAERQYVPSTRTVRRAAQIQLPLPTLIDNANMGGPEAVGSLAHQEEDEETRASEATSASMATSAAGPASTSAHDMAAMEAEAQRALADIGGLEGPAKKARTDGAFL